MKLKQKSCFKNITYSINNLIKTLNTKITAHNKELKSVYKSIILKNKHFAEKKYLQSASIVDLANKLQPFIASTKHLTKLLLKEKTTSLKKVHVLHDIKKNVYSLLNISEELNYLNSLDKIYLEKINLYVFYHTLFAWLRPYCRNKKMKLELQFLNKNIPLVLGNKNYLKTIIQEILNCTVFKNSKRKVIFKITPDAAKKIVITEIQNINISPKQEPKNYIKNHLKTKTFIKKKCKSENFWRLFKIRRLINNVNPDTKISYSGKNSNLIITLPVAD